MVSHHALHKKKAGSLSYPRGSHMRIVPAPQLGLSHVNLNATLLVNSAAAPGGAVSMQECSSFQTTTAAWQPVRGFAGLQHQRPRQYLAARSGSANACLSYTAVQNALSSAKSLGCAQQLLMQMIGSCCGLPSRPKPRIAATLVWGRCHRIEAAASYCPVDSRNIATQ